MDPLCGRRPASGFFFLTCSVPAISCSDAAHKSAANPPARLGFTLRHSVHQLRIRNRLRVKIGNTFRLEDVVKGRSTKELYCGHPRLYQCIWGDKGDAEWSNRRL